MITFHYISRLFTFCSICCLCFSCNQDERNSVHTTTQVNISPIENDGSSRNSTAKFETISTVSFFDEEKNSWTYYYSVFVDGYGDLDENVWADMMTIAKKKPHTKNGLTVVLFFYNKEYTPILTKSQGLNFDDLYSPYFVGEYWHYPNDKQEMKRHYLLID